MSYRWLEEEAEEAGYYDEGVYDEDAFDDYAEGLGEDGYDEGHEDEWEWADERDAFEMAHEEDDWLESEANPDEIVATTTPHWLYLKTGLKAVMPPFEADVSGAQRLIDSVPANYLVVDRLDFVDISMRYSVPIVKAFPERWALIYSSGKRGSQIYRRIY